MSDQLFGWIYPPGCHDVPKDPPQKTEDDYYESVSNGEEDDLIADFFGLNTMQVKDYHRDAWIDSPEFGNAFERWSDNG